MLPNFNSSSKPKLSAARLPADQRDRWTGSRNEAAWQQTCATAEVPKGSVVPDLLEANVRERKGVFTTPSVQTLGSVSSRSRDVIAVLPDAAVRVMLLDFETLPANNHAECVRKCGAFPAEKIAPVRSRQSQDFLSRAAGYNRPASSGGGCAHQRHRRLWNRYWPRSRVIVREFVAAALLWPRWVRRLAAIALRWS